MQAVRSQLTGLIMVFAVGSQLPRGVAETPPQAEMSIAVINVDGTGFQQLIAGPNQLYGSPSFSGDMQRLLFDGWPAGSQAEATSIFTANSDGSEIVELGPGAMPVWSPDESTMALHQYNVGVIVASADGVGREVLIPEGGSPAWSPDGSQLAVLRWGNDVQIMDVRTGKSRALNEVETFRPIPGFCWSPDGSEICLVVTQRRLGALERSLAIASATDPQQPLRFLESGLLDSRVAWSADGKLIAFSRSANATEPQQIYIARLDPGVKPVRLEGQPKDRSNIDPSWSPDGKRLLFASYKIVDTAVRVDEPDVPMLERLR